MNKVFAFTLFTLLVILTSAYRYLVDVPQTFTSHEMQKRTEQQRIIVGQWESERIVMDFYAWDGIEEFQPWAPWAALWSRNGRLDPYRSMECEETVRYLVNFGQIIPPDGSLYRNDSNIFKWFVKYVGEDKLIVPTGFYQDGLPIYQEKGVAKYEVTLVFFGTPIYETKTTTTTVVVEVSVQRPYLVLDDTLKSVGYGILLLSLILLFGCGVLGIPLRVKDEKREDKK